MNPESSSNLSSNKGPTLWGMLFAPTEQFERMIHRPRFGWALTVMMLAGSIVAAVSGLFDDPGDARPGRGADV